MPGTGASNIDIFDVAGNFEGDTVERALAELGGSALALRRGQNTARDGALIDDGTLPSAWTVASGTGSITAVNRKLNFATTAQLATAYRRDAAFCITKGGAILLRIRRDANLNGLDIALRTNLFGTIRTFSRSIQYAEIPVGEWFDLVLNAAYFGAVPPSGGRLADLANGVGITITATPVGATDTTIEIGAIRTIVGEKSSRVCFLFDDGRASQYTVAYPVLAANGYQGNIAVDHTLIGTANYATLGQLSTMYADGWSMSGHGPSPVSATEATAVALFQASKDYLRTNGFSRGSSHWIWPGGSRDITRDRWARRYFNMRRGTAPATNIATMRVAEPYDMPVRYVINSTGLAGLKTDFVDVVAEYGGCVVFVFHALVSSIVETEDYLISDFTALVQHCKARGLVGTSIDEVFSPTAPIQAAPSELSIPFVHERAATYPAYCQQANAALTGANRTHYARASGSERNISDLLIHIATQSGNIAVAVYANNGRTGRNARPGARKATSGSVACPASTTGVAAAAVALTTTIDIEDGDWLALAADNATATFARAQGSISNPGTSYYEAVYPPPAAAGTLVLTPLQWWVSS